MSNVRFLLIFFSYVFTSSCHNIYHEDKLIKILGGHACLNSDDFIVSLQIHGAHFCGGTLIHPRWVLTAASCDPRAHLSSFEANIDTKVLYPPGGRRIGVAKFIKHPKYEDITYSNNIALCQLKREVKHIVPVQLPPGPLDDNFISDYCHNGTLAGWGSLDDSKLETSSKLRCVDVDIITLKQCKKLYKRLPLLRSVCNWSKEKGACYGDTGGPLLCENTQVGVISLGIRCGKKHHPGVNVAVGDYLDWIWGIVDGKKTFRGRSGCDNGPNGADLSLIVGAIGSILYDKICVRY